MAAQASIIPYNLQKSGEVCPVAGMSLRAATSGDAISMHARGLLSPRSARGRRDMRFARNALIPSLTAPRDFHRRCNTWPPDDER